jgi:co-chaperonin GroES (HSP10)|tara:strand:+ start:561 stop:1139 length:579 start_codon:yes stop_codon:yes gene_type:complete
MRPLSNFVVYVPKKVNETKKIGDVEIYIETKFNEFEHRVMEGEVVGIPEKYKTQVAVGDTLYFHHHVVITPQVLDENNDLYQVNYSPDGGHATQSYIVKKKDTDEIIALDDWVFLDPIKPEAKLKSDILELVSFEEEVNYKGKIMYASDKIKELGLKIGDVVWFTKNSDYEMQIDDKKLWRVLIQNLTIVEK